MATAPDSQGEAERGIRRFNEAAKAALWTENARFLPPGRDVIIGRAGVRSFWQSGFDQGAYDLVLESTEIMSLGDGFAYEIGRSIVRLRTADGSSIEVPGKSLCIFRRDADGIWRADVDMFNAVES